MPPIETTPRSSERSTTAVTRIAGIDLDALTAALRSSHVAGVRSAADLDAVRSLVEAARANGLRLSVVCIGTTIGNDTTSRIAEQLFDRIDGTVVVLSPSLVSARSDQLTDAQRDTAVQSAAAAHSDQQAVSRFIDSALAFIDAGGTVPATSSSPGPRTVGGIPIDPIVAALGHDHIAIAKGVTGVTVQQLSGPVEHAWSKHLHLSVAILADDPSGHLYSVADAIKDRTGGTVIVVSPKRYAIASDSFDDQRLHAALQAGQDAAGDADFVTAVVASLLD